MCSSIRQVCQPIHGATWTSVSGQLFPTLNDCRIFSTQSLNNKGFQNHPIHWYALRIHKLKVTNLLIWWTHILILSWGDYHEANWETTVSLGEKGLQMNLDWTNVQYVSLLGKKSSKGRLDYMAFWLDNDLHVCLSACVLYRGWRKWDPEVTFHHRNVGFPTELN